MNHKKFQAEHKHDYFSIDEKLYHDYSLDQVKSLRPKVLKIEKYLKMQDVSNYLKVSGKTNFFKKVARNLSYPFLKIADWKPTRQARKASTDRMIAKLEKQAKVVNLPNLGKKKIVAEIDQMYLSFKNPAAENVRNIVLRGPSFKVYEGEVHAIIGESGSGKSVITSLLYGLAGKNAYIDCGYIKIYNQEVQNYDEIDWELSKLRGRVISAIFQNPMSTLNPIMKIGKQIMEGMLINGLVKNRKEAYKKAIHYLKLTKIEAPKDVMKLYPFELSGGMMQRVVIAAIVSLQPKILIMDEPTTALDPTVQALVLDVVRNLQKEFKIAVVFITHDLGVVASIADYISIMYAGQIVEEGTRDEILNYPQHPYTWGLISSMPDVNKGEVLRTIPGAVPSSLNGIVGDAFAVRNSYAVGIDFVQEPDYYYISPTHRVKSWLLNSQTESYLPPKVILEKWLKWDKKEI